MKYPIGVQSFEKIRTEGLVYIDKTDLVYKLTDSFQYVFLGRPRRFGKSLLMSTIQAYFEGKRELFNGLAIDRLASEWPKHPVLHLDFNIGNYSSIDGLMNLLENQLSKYEVMYGINQKFPEPQFRLQALVRQAYQLTGKKVVVLIDEYDKPVLQTMGNEALDRSVREILKPLFGVLKSEDQYIRFAMLTGVSKFGKLSVFSDLNNIKDISLNGDYATICGLTEEEVVSTFSEQIDEFGKAYGVSKERMIEDLRLKYDGYRFSPRDIHVFNPFSLLNAMSDKELNDYWFESGTPTFLVKLLKQGHYDISHLEGVAENREFLYREDNISAIPVLYQSGYLTIKDYDAAARMCILGYPNREVESAFLSFLLPYYSSGFQGNADNEIYKLTKEITSGDIDAFMTRLKSVFYSIPYTNDTSVKMQEDQFRNITYLTFKLLGFSVQAECHMCCGRTDVVIKTKDWIYVLEFKVDSTAESALTQILDKCYAEPYRVDGRKVMLVGANFSTKTRSLSDWQVAQLV